MALHFGKGSALACIVPATMLSCAGLFQHAGWGMIFTLAALSLVAAMSFVGALTFYVAACVRLFVCRARVRHLFVSRSLLTWAGIGSPLVVFASMALGRWAAGWEPDWRIVLPAMAAPGAIIGASLPRPLCRRTSG